MRAAVLGLPVAHSLSPVLHTAAYRALGLDGWRYDARECDEAGLPTFVAGLGPEWAGLSLTMPLKRVALAVADEVSPLATAIGAANTLVFTDGRRSADNTDVAGIVAALRAAGVGGAGMGGAGGDATTVGGAGVAVATASRIETEGRAARAGRGATEDRASRTRIEGDARSGGSATQDSAARARRGATEGGRSLAGVVSGRRAVVLGAGGTAQAALAALRELGIDRVDVLVRAVERAGELRAAADRLGMSPTLSDALCDPARASAAMRGADIVVSTLPRRAADPLAGPGAGTVVLDVVYAPWPTPFVARAAAAGANVVSGLEMLLHQAVVQVELMTGRPGPVAQMRAALDEAVAARPGRR